MTAIRICYVECEVYCDIAKSFQFLRNQFSTPIFKFPHLAFDLVDQIQNCNDYFFMTQRDVINSWWQKVNRLVTAVMWSFRKSNWSARVGHVTLILVAVDKDHVVNYRFTLFLRYLTSIFFCVVGKWRTVTFVLT